jgi:hypothetical protein
MHICSCNRNQCQLTLWNRVLLEKLRCSRNSPHFRGCEGLLVSQEPHTDPYHMYQMNLPPQPSPILILDLLLIPHLWLGLLSGRFSRGFIPKPRTCVLSCECCQLIQSAVDLLIMMCGMEYKRVS